LCHDREKRQQEHRGETRHYLSDTGPDGYPIDPNHPAYNEGNE
jgi:hypothetical protein